MTGIQFFYILVFISFIALVIFRKWYNSPHQKGIRGEERVHKVLMNLPDDYHIFDDVVLKTERGTTQIDHVVVSKHGVFAVETKNYRGDIYGDDNRQQWTQIIVTKVRYRSKWYKTYTYVTKNHLYNPVKQSLAHVYAIKNCLKKWPYLKVVPIVVFTGGADISKVKTSHHVIYDSYLVDTILSYRNTYLSDDEYHNVINSIASNNIRELVSERTHVSNIKSAKREQKYKKAMGICPSCGGRLVLRSGKYGSFYGCSNYPKCKYTTK